MPKKKLAKTKNLVVETGEEKRFWVCDGRVLKNLRELADVLEKMPKDVFNHHVTKERNDFAIWVNDVFGDKKLAGGLKKAKTAKGAAKKIRTAIR